MSVTGLLTPREQEVLGAIEAAARAGEPCPGNDVIACIVGCSSTATASNQVKSLERKGVIVVKRFQQARQITIVRSGISTAEPKDRRTHWRNRPRRTRQQWLDLLAKEVAGGLSVAEAGMKIGATRAQAERFWRDIKRGLGWQAS